jgi:hypothetical protein
MRENQDKYRIPEMMSFTQVYFSPAKREDAMEAAKTVLAHLEHGEKGPEEAH